MNAISFSMTDTYGRCPKLFEYKYIRDLQPVRMSNNLWKGIKAHDILRDWFLWQRDEGYAHPDPAGFVHNWIEAFWADYDGDPLFADEMQDARKELELIGEFVIRFLEKGLYDEHEILHVEEEFIVMIDNDVVSFTPDLVTRDPDGHVWVIDHKTTSNHIRRDALDVKPQPLFYYMGVREFYPEVAGFILNYIRKKVPTEPRLNKRDSKDGVRHVNDVNRIDTTYEKLYSFLQENAPHLMDLPLYKRRLADLRDEDTFFFQHINWITDDMVEETAEDISARLDDMKHSDKRGTFPRTIQPLNGCRRCDFQPLCFTELTGGNTELVLQSYEERDSKNPYEREDDDDSPA